MSYESYCSWRDRPLCGEPAVSVVIPTYNEERRIVPTIAAVAVHLAGSRRSFEIVVSDDGSTDDTVATVERLGLPNVILLDHGVNRGKGAAVRDGVAAARGEQVLFSDADLSTPIEEIDGLLARLCDGADVAVASRALDASCATERSSLRRLLSAVLRLLVRVIVPVDVTDTQCGFKAFTRESAEVLFGESTLDGFSFDLEVLHLAHRRRLSVEEVPVEWIDAPGSKVDPLRDTARFLSDLVRIRWRHRGGRLALPTGRGLRVGVVTTHPPSEGSLTEYGRHLVSTLAGRPDVASVVVLGDVEPAAHEVPAGVSAVRCWRFGSWLNAVRIWRAVRRERVDAVLFNVQFATFGPGGPSAALGLVTPALCRLGRTPTIVVLHNLVDTVDLGAAGFTENRVVARVLVAFGRLVTRAVLLADRVAVTIPGYVDILRERYGAENVYLAPHGSFGEAEPASTAVPPGPARILTFGKFGTYKRVETLLAANDALRARGLATEVVVAGTDSPNAPGYLDGIRATLPDDAGVRFTGYVEEEDVPALFTSASVVVFPYTATTGSSGPLHQAGEHGRAVVLPEIGDFLELVAEEGYATESFQVDDALSLAGAIERVVTDPARREELAARNSCAAAGVPLRDVVDWHLTHLGAVMTGRA